MHIAQATFVYAHTVAEQARIVFSHGITHDNIFSFTHARAQYLEELLERLLEIGLSEFVQLWRRGHEDVAVVKAKRRALQLTTKGKATVKSNNIKAEINR